MSVTSDVTQHVTVHDVVYMIGSSKLKAIQSTQQKGNVTNRLNVSSKNREDQLRLVIQKREIFSNGYTVAWVETIQSCYC